MAGLTVGVMLVPQGIAYAYLAGMPPIYGLYAGLVPLFLYALLGSSRQLSIGPVAISALLVLAGVSRLAEPGSPEYISLVITTGLLIGIVQFILSILRMGFLVNFISHPVIAGFTSAAAIIIVISQLKDFLGIFVPHFSHPFETLYYIFEHITQTNGLTVLICISSIIAIFTFKKINRKIPGPLIVVVISIFLSWFFEFKLYDVSIIEKVPEGLPIFVMPQLDLTTIQKLIPTVLMVTVIGVVESIGIAKTLEAKHKDYVVNPNQELLALGISKIGGSFFQALPTSGSFTRSAVNNDAGAKTTVASLITASLITLTLLFLTPLFYYLPKATLAAIVLLAVVNLFDYKEALHLWKTDRSDLLMMGITFIATLLFGIAEGVFIGVLLSVGYILYRSTKPAVKIIGNVEGTTYYRDQDRFDVSYPTNDMLIVRFDSQLYFGNAAFFKEAILEHIDEYESKVRYLFLDAKSIYDIDSSGLHALESLYTTLQERDIQLYIAGAIGRFRDMVIKSGLREKIGNEHLFLYLHDAVETHLERCKRNEFIKN